MDTLRHIACLIYPDVMSLDVVGPMQVFASANVELERQGLPSCYVLKVLADTPGPVTTSAGLRLYADLAWRDVEPATLDTLLIAGGRGVEGAIADAELLAWLASAEGQVRRLGSICSGALILAAAAVLDGRVATTHWADTDELCQRHPAVQVQAGRLHTYDPLNRDGDAHVFTSAGVTAGIDLALALVEADLGRPIALSVARRLVMFLRRPGDQAQFSAMLAPSSHRLPRLAALLDWLPGNLGGDLSLAKLAERACLAPRTLSRLFVDELGMSPGRYVERIRVEAARALLQDRQMSVSTIARLTGFGHPENLRRSFHKQFAISPQDYMARFT